VAVTISVQQRMCIAIGITFLQFTAYRLTGHEISLQQPQPLHIDDIVTTKKGMTFMRESSM
jgi:hypothetical protein